MHIIWTNELNYDDWRKDLEAQYPSAEGYNDENRKEIMYETNDEYFRDEVITLDKEFNRNIVLVADVGRWDGRKGAYKHLGTNLNSIFSFFCGDYLTWFISGEDVKAKDVHHDGTNHYTYKLLKEGISKFEFDEYVYEHSLDEAVEQLTEPIGKYVKEIYGIEEEENERTE